MAPPRLDLQYLQVKVLEDISNPGSLFSHAANSGAMGWESTGVWLTAWEQTRNGDRRYGWRAASAPASL